MHFCLFSSDTLISTLLGGFSLEESRIGKKIIREVIKDLEGDTKVGKKNIWKIIILLLLIMAAIVAVFLHKQIFSIWQLLF